jgi:hypothetical protein
VLHDEPSRLLLDDLRETTQAASILALIGQGCHRPSEIAARLGKPATSLARPLQRLLELELVARHAPFGSPPRGGKRALYQIADPFLRFWFRFVEPNRSRLAAGLLPVVARDVGGRFSHHVGGIWEELARRSVPFLTCFGESWGPASRWWGPGRDRRPLEVDLVAESTDKRSLLVGEARWTSGEDTGRVLQMLAAKADNLPFVDGRRVVLGVWARNPRGRPRGACVFTPRDVLRALR